MDKPGTDAPKTPPAQPAQPAAADLAGGDEDDNGDDDEDGSVMSTSSMGGFCGGGGDSERMNSFAGTPLGSAFSCVEEMEASGRMRKLAQDDDDDGDSAGVCSTCTDIWLFVHEISGLASVITNCRLEIGNL